MAITLAIFASLALAAFAQQGPTGPYVSDFQCERDNQFVVDATNMCWYHQCVNGSPMPRRCALGSKVSYNYIVGDTNPCTVNFDSEYGYECNRAEPSVDGPPSCHPVECFNDGVAVYEANYCWCQCPASWRGDFDCSKPTRDPVNTEYSSLCLAEDGGEDGDACLSDPCQNGGVCHDVCLGYWCECPAPEASDNYANERFQYGKNCEVHPDA